MDNLRTDDCEFGFKLFLFAYGTGVNFYQTDACKI